MIDTVVVLYITRQIIEIKLKRAKVADLIHKFELEGDRDAVIAELPEDVLEVPA